MAYQIFATSLSGAGTRAALGNTDSVAVGAGVIIGSTDTTTIVGTGSNHIVDIRGSVYGESRAIDLGDDGAVDVNEFIKIGTQGYVSTANSSVAAIKIGASDSVLENAGTVSAMGYFAIYFQGTKTDTTSTLRNSGLIEAKTYGVSSSTENLTIENTGTIKAAFALYLGNGNDTVLNDGKIFGDVLLGIGADTFDTRDGTYTGSLSAGDGADTLHGNSKANTFNGDGGNDRIYGYEGNDILSGGAGDDYISGSSGKDKIAGDLGKDQLRGGADADTFIFKTLTDSTTTAVGRDLILDFSQSQKDKIDLALIDAKASTGADNSFSFIGKNSFTQAEGQLRYKTESGVTKIYGDTNGDGTADFAIWLDGVYTLKATDFIL